MHADEFTESRKTVVNYPIWFILIFSENSESRDSLDENAIGTESSPPSSHMRSFVGSDRDTARRNDLNRTFHKNLIYNNSRMDTNSTCLILKKHLETTEL